MGMTAAKVGERQMGESGKRVGGAKTTCEAIGVSSNSPNKEVDMDQK